MLLLRIVFVGLLAFTSPVTGVRGGWSLVGDYEYMVSPLHSTMSYREAQAYCKSQGLNGELAFVKSQEVQILIEDNVQGYLFDPVALYIGLYDENLDLKFYWNDGESLNYTNWNVGEPRNAIPNEMCVTMGHNNFYDTNLKWSNQICDKADTGYVCQRKRGRGIWNALGEYNYYVSTAPPFADSYNSAQSFCKSLDAELAFVKSQEIQEFIEDLIFDNGHYNSAHIQFGFYIGLRDIGNNGVYFWADGEVLNYSYWQNRFPVESYGNCVVMSSIYINTKQRRWQNRYCTDSADFLLGLVCQRARNGNTQIATTQVTTSPSAQNSGTTTIIEAVIGVIGVLVFLFAIFIVFTLLLRRQRQKYYYDGQRNYVNIEEDPTVDPDSLQAEGGQVSNSFGNYENNYAVIKDTDGAHYATISPPAGNYENTIPSEENDGEYNMFNRSGANPNVMEDIAKRTSQEAGSNNKCSTIEVRESEGYSRIHLSTAAGEVDSTYNTLNETSKNNVIPLCSVVKKN